MCAFAERNQSVGRSASMVVEGSCGVSWSDEEVLALIAVWRDSLLHTKPTHSPPVQFSSSLRGREKTATQVVLGYVMRPAHD